MEATFVRNIEGWKGDARLYKLSKPYHTYDGDDVDHIIVSAVIAYSGPETYVFPATADGEAVDMLELPGSFDGSLDHEEALLGFCASDRADAS